MHFGNMLTWRLRALDTSLVGTFFWARGSSTLELAPSMWDGSCHVDVGCPYLERMGPRWELGFCGDMDGFKLLALILPENPTCDFTTEPRALNKPIRPTARPVAVW